MASISKPPVRVDGAEVEYEKCPEVARETLRRYIEHGIYPGSGYASILRMDLTAVLLVDEETLKQLPAIVRWLHNHAPSGCKGGNGRVIAWMAVRQNA